MQLVPAGPQFLTFSGNGYLTMEKTQGVTHCLTFSQKEGTNR